MIDDAKRYRSVVLKGESPGHEAIQRRGRQEGEGYKLKNHDVSNGYGLDLPAKVWRF